MDFGYTLEQEALRQEVRQFIAENMTPEVQTEIEYKNEGNLGPLATKLFNKIGERGWLGISWPKEYGGQAGSRIDQYIVEEEFARIGVTVGGNGVGLGKTVVAVGGIGVAVAGRGVGVGKVSNSRSNPLTNFPLT